jgi:hypothetical protein
MTYEEFLDFVLAKCMYETIYDDSDYKTILVIRMLDAYGMVNKAQRTWVGLTDEEIKTICLENGWDSSWQSLRFARAIENALRSKNNG